MAVLWDLDGTLVDSSADIAAAVDRALTAHDLPALGEQRVRKHIGSGAQHLVSTCVAEAGGVMTDELLATFFLAYRAHVADHTRLYPGIAELLVTLDVPQAVVTNKPISLTRDLLKALAIDHHFGAVYGGESLPKRKPDPMMLYAAMADLRVQSAVMVGDGPHDVAAGRAAGLPVIGVGWGIATPEGADLRVTSVPQLAALLLGTEP